MPYIGRRSRQLKCDWTPHKGTHVTADPVRRQLLTERTVLSVMSGALVTGVMFGLATALQASRVDLVAAMKRVVRGRSSRHSNVGATLVVVEVALAVMLLVGAALLIRTSMALRAVDAGFDAHNVVTMRTSVTATRFETRAGIAQLTHEDARHEARGWSWKTPIWRPTPSI